MGERGLGVGLIGTGYMGKCHALAWRSVGAVFGDVAHPRLVQLAEVDADLARNRAAAFGFERSTSDWRILVEDPDVDIVSITTPNELHAEIALAALAAGKHVWCEKPMATSLADAWRMLDAARASGRIAALGYNYIQNPMIRHAHALIEEGVIGRVNHVRVEMDEDFMADPETPFSWKSDSGSGHGALDDFAVHPLSLLQRLVGSPMRVVTLASRPYAERPTIDGGSRPVETDDIATSLLEFHDGISGLLAVNRSAWGRKGRIAIQIFGSAGSIVYDQERMNELAVFRAEGRTPDQGFCTILAGPTHPLYNRFIPAPGHGLGFNDLKIIECREILSAVAGSADGIIDFEQGFAIEVAVEAMARSARERRWVDVREVG